MPTSRNDTRVKCPFYQYDESVDKKNLRRITCEGLIDCSTLVLNYRFKRDYRIQLETFCCEYFDRCEVYRMLMQKYEEDNV
jgi:hypothetical protein